MLRNPAYAGRACFGKTMRTESAPGSTAPPAWPGAPPPRVHGHRPAPASDWLEIPVPALVAEDTWQRVQRRLADNKRFASRNSQGPLAAARHWPPARLRLRLLPHLDPHHQQEDLLLPVPRLGRLPLRARPGLRQQAGPRRLPRHRRLGPHHRPARRPGPDPHRDRQAARPGPHRRPRHRPAPASRAGTGQGHHGDHPADRAPTRSN